MTDIRQHLPVILTSIRRYLTEAETVELLRASLRDLLPASYGLGVGRLVDAQGQQSRALDIIIYDTTINSPQPTPDLEPGCYDLSRALAVVVLAQDIETPALRDLLDTIASVKKRASSRRARRSEQLAQTARQKTSRPALKGFLPLGIVAYRRLLDAQSEEAEIAALYLDALLKEQPEDLRPDYLLAQGLTYCNPLLDGGTFEPGTVNIACEPGLPKPRPCYVCKQQFRHAHFFYHSLCLRCGDFNYQKRSIPGNFTGWVALVTGARIKIGYATALRLLRAGMQVLATTRFPHDAARRYSYEPDFADWKDRLHIYGLDFRYLPVLERFITHLHVEYPSLDILINNAAQTVRRPLNYYTHLLALEQAPLSVLTPAQQALVKRSHMVLPPTPFAAPGDTTPALLTDAVSEQHSSAALLHTYGTSAILSHQSEPSTIFPVGLYDEHQQQIDLRMSNSWTLPFNEIDLTEFLEVQIINVTAPFLLLSRLYPLLVRSPFAQRFVINVSAVEGQFANAKFGSHVHTNMAKASLNMLTHTAAARLARDQIFMNSVDPGWISQQSPLTDVQQREKIQRLLPLDLVDAAARICDPIFLGITTGHTLAGQFYKDYQPVPW